jgi:hypothetical protein
VSPQGTGNLYVPVGLGDNPALRNTFPAEGQTFGWLVKGNPSGKLEAGAQRHLRVRGFPRSRRRPAGNRGRRNPYAVAAVPGGEAVADAGGNDLLWVDGSGDVSLLAVFPVRFVPFAGGPIPMQSVPTR